jgi:hypothetical protein
MPEKDRSVFGPLQAGLALAVVGLLGQGIWTARDARKGYGRGED